MGHLGKGLFTWTLPPPPPNTGESVLPSTDDQNAQPKRDWTQLPNHRGHLTHAQWTCQTGFQYGRHPETPAHSWHNSDALQPRGPGRGWSAFPPAPLPPQGRSTVEHFHEDGKVAQQWRDIYHCNRGNGGAVQAEGLLTSATNASYGGAPPPRLLTSEVRAKGLTKLAPKICPLFSFFLSNSALLCAPSHYLVCSAPPTSFPSRMTSALVGCCGGSPASKENKPYCSWHIFTAASYISKFHTRVCICPLQWSRRQLRSFLGGGGVEAGIHPCSDLY